MYAEVDATYQDLTPEEQKDKKRKTVEFFQTVRTRIFTSTDVKRLDLKREWLAAVNTYLRNKPHDLQTFENTYEALAQKLVDAATAQKV